MNNDLSIWLKMAHRIVNDDSYSAHGKDVQLAGLLSMMESIYSIPCTYNEKWILRNPSIYAVYLHIGQMRNL